MVIGHTTYPAITSAFQRDSVEFHYVTDAPTPVLQPICAMVPGYRADDMDVLCQCECIDCRS